MNKQTKHTDARQGLLDTAHTLMSGKGFSGVGLSEILAAAEVPKGSFYHYFSSKEVFGEELLRRYFDTYLAAMDDLFSQKNLTGAERLECYWQNWMETQTASDAHSKCLVVKLAAEVADLSEAMRQVLLDGTKKIVRRIADAIDDAVADGSLSVDEDSLWLAETLYQSWLGASLLAKISKNDAPLQTALAATHRTLNMK